MAGFDFPRKLRKKKARGKIVLLVQLDPTGEVADVRIDSSNLPEFDEYVVSEVRSWSFTPPTHQGQPVSAQAKLPIAININ